MSEEKEKSFYDIMKETEKWIFDNYKRGDTYSFVQQLYEEQKLRKQIMKENGIEEDKKYDR